MHTHTWSEREKELSSRKKSGTHEMCETLTTQWCAYNSENQNQTKLELNGWHIHRQIHSISSTFKFLPLTQLFLFQIMNYKWLRCKWHSFAGLYRERVRIRLIILKSVVVKILFITFSCGPVILCQLICWISKIWMIWFLFLCCRTSTVIHFTCKRIRTRTREWVSEWVTYSLFTKS